MNMDCNSLSHIHLTKDEMLSPHDWKGNMDLLNIVLVGITNDIPDHEGKYEMHRLIGALLSSELKEQEKLDIIEHEDSVEVIMKNMAAEEIKFDPNEIVERFVRGDESRNTEGSGLGLAIAKSFVEVQGGTFRIEIDGDLFKVIMKFKK